VKAPPFAWKVPIDDAFIAMCFEQLNAICPDEPQDPECPGGHLDECKAFTAHEEALESLCGAEPRSEVTRYVDISRCCGEYDAPGIVSYRECAQDLPEDHCREAELDACAAEPPADQGCKIDSGAVPEGVAALLVLLTLGRIRPRS
jgi:hypothetical protein